MAQLVIPFITQGLTAAGVGAKTAAAIGSGLSIASTGLSVFSAISQGNAQADAAKAQAGILESRANSERVAASVNAERERRRARQRQSAQRGMAIESLGGGALQVGTTQGVLDQAAVYDELDALTIKYNGDLRASGFDAQADQSRAQAGGFRSAGYLKAATALTDFIPSDPFNMSNAPQTAPRPSKRSVYGGTSYLPEWSTRNNRRVPGLGVG